MRDIDDTALEDVTGGNYKLIQAAYRAYQVAPPVVQWLIKMTAVAGGTAAAQHAFKKE